MTGNTFVGGLVGTNFGDIVSSYSTGVVTGDYSVGGLVGTNWDSTVSNSYATGSVTGDDGVGGLVGLNEEGTVSGSYAMGSVTGNYSLGGLVGWNEGQGNISNSYATGSVTGNDNVGGLVGTNLVSTVSNSYATGSVKGNSDVGGLVGYNYGGTVTASYYNRQTTGQNDTGKGEPKTTAELLTPTGYTGIYATWDDDTDYWDFGTNGQYPVLKIDVNGNGTAGEAADLRAQRPLRFRQTSYAFAIPNTASINDVVGIVRGLDVNNELTYSMDPSAEFYISSEAETDNPSKVGQISVKAALSTNTYTLNVKVMEAGGGTATVEVRIKVEPPLDADEDGLIKVSTLEQLNAIRYDLDGDGTPTEAGMAEYTTAFGADRVPAGATTGYELMVNLDFNDANSYASDTINTNWTTGSGWEPIGYYTSFSNNSPFSAIFEGNGHTISNLYINRPSTNTVGLFGYVRGSSAELRNIGLLEVNVKGEIDVGGLVGFNYYQSKVSNSYATGSVTGNNYVGGLVGYNYGGGTVSNSYATGSVTGDHYVGGLVGVNYGDISNSYATGAVKGDDYVGGLVGYNNNGTVSGSYAMGSVTGNYSLGGLVGWNEGQGNISNSYATGSVTGNDNVGGLVGTNLVSTVSNSYATGSVKGNSDVGGLVGGHGTVTASYYNRQTTGQNDTGKGESKTTAELLTPTGYTGIYATWGDDTDYWDFGTNGQYPVLKIDVDGNGSVGDATDLRAQRPLRFTQTSYAFAIPNTASINDVVGIVRGLDVNNELTYSMDPSAEFYISSEAETDNPSKVGQISVKAALSPNTYTLNVKVMEAGGGTATVEVRVKVGTPLDADEDGLIEVSTLEQLNAIRYDLDGNGEDITNEAAYSAAFGIGICTGCTGYELMNDLDFNDANSYASDTINTNWTTGSGWEPIGYYTSFSNNSPFSAIFEGNGHTISNLYINRPSTNSVGLFRYVRGSSAELRNIGLLEVNVTGNDNVGGLVGRNYGGTVSNSYATGAVKGDDFVGGLVGRNYRGGTVSNSYATGAVKGDDFVGGLVGYNNQATVSGSYTMGSVTGNYSLGGLVGWNSEQGNISNSYATGSVTGNDNVGGLVGTNWVSTVSNSYATGSVTGTSDVGGLVGYNGNTGDISNSYATGSVTGDDSVGGLVGGMGRHHSGMVSNSYATGAVKGNSDVGGLVGYNNNSTVTASYYNRQTTGQNDTGKGESKTTAELLTPTGYTGIYATWDDDTDYWDFGTNGQYPVLKIDVNGNGTAGDATDLALQRPPRLSVNLTRLDFTAMGEDMEFMITSNAVWTAEVSAGDTWLTLDSGSGNANMTITATAQENLGTDRIATITITSGTLTQTINVTQGAGTRGAGTQGARAQTVLLAVPVIPTSMRVYPNPTSGQLRFTDLSSDQRYTYRLYSLVTQKIRSGQINGGEHIDLGGDFPEGQYILVLQTEEGRELLRSRVQVVK